MNGLRQIFESLVDLPVAQRRRQLVSLDLPDEQVHQLQALFDADSRTHLLDSTLAQTVERLRDPHDLAAQLVGTRAGSFVLRAPIGEGGSALVFRAERSAGTGVQTAAVKVLHSAQFSLRAERRFQREQAIVASLDHPNIARLIEGGVTERGQPYLAMDFVDGSPLTVHADEQRLDLQQRLALFGTLCSTVDAAHAALIIHRDLKPSNVLVSAGGELKVLDFGIARAQDDDTAQDATATLSLTPEYAAPEQFRPGLATVAVDIFALGVILAELLTGQRLRGGRASQAVARSAEAVPAALGARRELVRQLRGDLDAIIAKALSDEPAQRYRTARDFALDVSRFLRREPVLARRGTAWYVAKRFVRRNWEAVGFSAVALAALLASLGFAYRSAIRAEAEATRAIAQAQRADALRGLMLDVMAEADPVTPRSGDVTVKQAVERAIERIPQLRSLDARSRTDLLVALASTLGRTGEGKRALGVLRTVQAAAVAQFGADDPLSLDAALTRANYEKQQGHDDIARALLDELAPRIPPSDTVRRGELLRHSSSVAWHQREHERALREGREALRLARDSGDRATERRSLNSLGAVLLSANRIEEAATIYRGLLRLDREEFGENHEQTALAYSGLARALRRLGHLDAAEQAARSAVAIDSAIYPQGHGIQANHLNALTLILIQQRNFDAALESGQEGLEISRRWLADGNPQLFFAVGQVGSVLLNMERYDEAVVYFREALQGRETALGAAHFDTAVTRSAYGYALGLSGDRSGGLQQLQQAVTDIGATQAPDPELLARALERQATLALAAGQLETASSSLRTLRGAWSTFSAAITPYWKSRTLLLEGQIALRANRGDQAVAAFRDGLAAADSSAMGRIVRIELLLRLAQQQRARGEAEAAGTLREARQVLQQARWPPPSLRRLLAEVENAG